MATAVQSTAFELASLTGLVAVLSAIIAMLSGYQLYRGFFAPPPATEAAVEGVKEAVEAGNQESDWVTREEGAETRHEVRKDGERTREEIAALKAEILEEMRKDRDAPLDAEDAARVDEAVERILSSNDARLKPVEEDLREENYDDAYSRLMGLGSQSAAGASDLASDAFEHFSNAGALFLGRDTLKAIAAYEAARDAKPDHFWTRVELARLYMRGGRTGDAEVEATTSESYATTDRERSIAQTCRGNALLVLGNTEAALVVYDGSLGLKRDLLASDPNSAEAKRDLSISLDKVGDVFLRQGRMEDALASYEEGLGVRRDLLASDTNSAEAKRDLSISLDKVGDVFLRQGRTDEALASYEEGLGVARDLLASDTKSAEAKRDLSISLNKVGDVLLRKGRTDEALTSFEEGLGVRRDLLVSDPGSAEAKRDVVVSLAKLSGVSGEAGRSYWAEAHRLVSELSESGRLDPTDAWMLDETAKKAGITD